MASTKPKGSGGAESPKTVSSRDASSVPGKRRFGPVEVFYARTIAIEREAAARYREFAHQMAGYGNARTAELFMRLARFESEHAEQLLEKTAGMKLPSIEQMRRGLVDGGCTGIVAYEFLYRRVLPQHALLMALAAERRAKACFDRTRKAAADPQIRKLSAAFAREEAGHIAWIERALAAEPQTEPRFDDLAD